VKHSGKKETGSRGKRAEEADQKEGRTPGKGLFSRRGEKGTKKKMALDGVPPVTTATGVRRPDEAAALAEREHALRREKVKNVKTQLARGTYRVTAKEVAKAMARREVTRLLSEEAGPKK
jgi:anti-sigma28 factor (negative regulator of flagellin synthesis)